MSKQVDERVVSMQFDNKHFEENVKTTMGSLDKLREKLSFKDASKGFNEIDKAAKNTDMSPLAKSVETVRARFSALEVMGVTALANITNSAVNASKRMVKALTLDPIMTGFQEYETQINSVQTILANTESKGSTLQDVNNALAELNTYADKTIYNFTEMTRNIGTFTAAGVDLKTSVSAIKGIANLAAVSGSNSQQASTAMYQLSQALASGTVKLMDWNSVVNAGMGGQVFQDSLKETARIHGIKIDAMIKKEGSFRETLKDGWLTSEILTETLAKFTGDLSEAQLKSMGYTDEQIKGIVKMGKTANDAATKVKTFTQLFDTLKEAAQSGWTKSWELMIGDFGEAKELLTDISDLVGGIIGDSADKRNALLMGGLSTGWKQLLNEGIHDAAGFEETVSNVAKEHGVDIASMIDDEHSFQDVLKQSLKDGTLTSDVLGESIAKFTEKTSAMSAAELEAAGYTKDHIEKLKELDQKVKDGTVSMEEFANLIVRPSGRELLIESLWNSIKGLQSVLTPVKQAFEEVFPAATGEQLYKLIEGLRDFTAKLTLSEDQGAQLKAAFKGLFSVISVGVNIFKSLVSGCVKLLGALTPIGKGLLDVGGSFGSFATDLSKTANKVISLDGIFEGLARLLHSLSTGVGETLSALAGGIERCGGFIGIIRKIADVFGQLFDRITIAMPGNSIFDTLFDLVNGGVLVTIGIHISKFMKNVSGMAENLPDILGGVGDALEAFTGSIKAGTLQKIATAIGILAASLFVLSLIKPERLTTALIAIGVLFKGLMASMTSFGKVLDGNAFKGISKVTGAMIGVSVALLILSGALKILSTIPLTETAIALGAMVVGLYALVRAVNLLPEKDIKKAAKAMKTLSTSLVVLAIALKIMGSMTWQEMLVGLVGMVVGLYALVGAVNLLPKDTKTKAGSMLILASAMVVLSAAFKILGTMSWQELAVGIVGVVVGLGALVGALHLLPKDIAGKAGSVFILATAMIVLGAALKILTTMSWTELAISIGAMALSLGVLVGALWLLPKDVAGKAASILILSTAMVVLGAALKILGSMSIDQLAKGIGAIAATLIVLGIAGYALAPVTGVLLAIGGAIALLGIGCVAAGAGLILIATGITALAAAIVGSAGIIVAGANELVGVFTTIILSLVTAIVACVPAVTNGLLQLLVSVLGGLVQYTPQLVTLLFNFVIGLINGVAARLPELIQAGVNLLMAFFSGVVEALKSIDTSVLIEGIIGVGLIAGLIVALSAISGFIPGAMVAILGIGAVIAELAIVLAAIGALAQIPGLEWLIGEGGALLEKIGTAIGQFIGGIVGGIAKGITSALPEIGADLSGFMINAMPFIEGVKTIDAAVLEGAKSLVEILLLLTGASLLDALTSWLTGGNSLADFGSQLGDFGEAINTFSEKVSGVDSEAIVAAASSAKMLAEMAKAIPNDFGNNNLKNFGGQFEEFGECIVAFSNTVESDLDIGSIKNAVEGGKLLTDMAKAIPNDLGNNNLKNFGSQLESFGGSLSTFSTDVSGKTGGLKTAGADIKELIASLSDVNSSKAVEISMFGNALLELAQNGIKGFVDAFNGAGAKINEAISTFISITCTSLSTNSTTLYNGFQSAGSYAIDGFVSGLSSSTGLARVTAAGTTIGNYALKAAKKAIDSNSPSKKFEELGLFSILGFSKGVSDNLKTVDESGRSIGVGVLTALQDELEIHSPSVVMNKQGHYIVQGVAEGIKKDMSAEEAAEKKAQNIVSAFQKEFDKVDISRSIAQNEFDIWKLTDGKNASSYESNRKEQEFLNGEAERLAKNVSLSYDKWRQTIAHGFKEGSQEEREAFNEYKEAILSQEENNKTLRELKLQEWDNMAEIAQNEIDMADSEYQTWLATEGRYASKEEQYAKLQEYLDEEHTWLLDIRARALWKLEWLKENAGTQEEIAAAQKAYNDVTQKVAENEDKRDNLDYTRQYGDGYDQFDKNEEKIDRERRLWMAKHGDTASEQVKLQKEIEFVEEEVKNAVAEQLLIQQEYNNILADYNNGKATAEQLEAVRIKLEEAEIESWERSNELGQLKKDLVEEQRDNAKDIAELASEIAQHEYDIWEKTTGRKATDTEKDIKRLEIYARQIQSQREIYEMALEDMRIAADTYGKDSQEYRDAYREFLTEQMELVSMQDEILTIQENLQKRQKKQYNKQQLAMSEYKDYIKKYKQYYLEHGLTMEELEADAKAAANYDPTKTVENVVDKTSYALNTALNASGAVSLGASYVKSVTAGMTENISTVRATTQSMLDTCSEILTEAQAEWLELGKQCITAFGNGINENKLLVVGYARLCAHMCIQNMKTLVLWRDAGKQCVMGFANGIRANSWIAEQAAAYVAREAIAAARSTFDINSPSKVFWDTAKYCVEGLAGGFTDNSNLSKVAAKSLAEDAINSFTLAIAQITDAVDSEMDVQPTIRPVLDLSNVERGAVRLSNMFSRDQALGISAMRNPDNNLQNQNGVDSNRSEGKTINYVQNNYSPKALSPTDIYRRTKNQLSAMKGVL